MWKSMILRWKLSQNRWSKNRGYLLLVEAWAAWVAQDPKDNSMVALRLVIFKKVFEVVVCNLVCISRHSDGMLTVPLLSLNIRVTHVISVHRVLTRSKRHVAMDAVETRLQVRRKVLDTTSFGLIRYYRRTDRSVTNPKICVNPQVRIATD